MNLVKPPGRSHTSPDALVEWPVATRKFFRNHFVSFGLDKRDTLVTALPEVSSKVRMVEVFINSGYDDPVSYAATLLPAMILSRRILFNERSSFGLYSELNSTREWDRRISSERSVEPVSNTKYLSAMPS